MEPLKNAINPAKALLMVLIQHFSQWIVDLGKNAYFQWNYYLVLKNMGGVCSPHVVCKYWKDHHMVCSVCPPPSLKALLYAKLSIDLILWYHQNELLTYEIEKVVRNCFYFVKALLRFSQTILRLLKCFSLLLSPSLGALL